jgi:8-oxo-dGTP pyrophosphatase MutT (NUDIX family)
MSAGVILVDQQGRILLQLRDDRPDIMFPGHWGITGGAGHKGESPQETASREVLEETGLSVSHMAPFKVYRFSRPEKGCEYIQHFFYARTDSPADQMTVGEGQCLRFIAPEELDGLPIAYNHREVLAEFVTSPEYQACLDGAISPKEDEEALDHLRQALASGADWFTALTEAIALWRQPEETLNGRRYRYLIEGEAFDWLLLAERLCEAADGIPAEEKEALLFFGRLPVELGEGQFRRLLGPAKHRAHLNYRYGVTVEEALQLAVEEELHKERRCHVWSGDGGVQETAFERIYDRPREDLLADFREARGFPQSDSITYGELKEFTYWLFKHRLRRSDPARVASDTRKALARLSEVEEASRRRQAARSSLPQAGGSPSVVVDVEEGAR